MRRLSLLLAVTLMWGVVPTVRAQVVKLGSEFQVNTFTSGDQENARVGTDASGNFVVVWTSHSADGNRDAAAVQRYTSVGVPLGTEFFANTYTTNDQGVPQVAVQPNGNFIVVWQSFQGSGGDNIRGQRFDSGGSTVGTEFQVNTFTSGAQENPAVAVDPAGDFVVVWEGNTASDNAGIGGRRFDSSGAPVGTEFQVNTFTSGEAEKPQVAMDGTGNFTVVYESHHFDGDFEGVAVQRYDNTGATVGTEFQANTFTSGRQEHAAIAMDSNGNFVVVWDSTGQHDGSSEGIFGQRFNSSGTKVGTEFQANTYTTSEQEDPAVALESNGNFVVVWYSGRYGGNVSIPGQDGDRDGAFGQRFSSSGTRLGTEFQINTFTSDNQTDPKVAAQPGGKFVVVWYSESSAQDGSEDSVHAQRFGTKVERVPALGSTNLAVLAGILLVMGGAALVRRRHGQA